jgi:RsiW-degrading membrane proteinase PrsW (M82 family)
MGGYIVSVAIRKPQVLFLVAIYLVATLSFPKWLDQHEIEPKPPRYGAFIWGALVATFTAGLVNTGFERMARMFVGPQYSYLLGAVICAPIVEEGLKTFGVIRTAKYGDLDTPVDGIVYAVYVSLGFSAVEDILYFDRAGSGAALTLTFFLRAVLTPMAHPLFTMWSGKWIGKAVIGQMSMNTAIFLGWITGVCLHSLFNLLASMGVVFFIAYPFWVVFFTACALHTRSLKRAELSQIRLSLSRLHSEFAKKGLKDKGKLEKLAQMIEERSSGFSLEGKESLASQTALYRLTWVSQRQGRNRDPNLENELIETINQY